LSEEFADAKSQKRRLQQQQQQQQQQQHHHQQQQQHQQQQINDDDGADDDGFSLPPNALLADDKNKCSRCAQKYGWLRNRRLRCENCHDTLCSACSGVYQFKPLGWAQPRRCCFQCSEDLAALVARVAAAANAGTPPTAPRGPVTIIDVPFARRNSSTGINAAAADAKPIPVPPPKRAQAAALAAARNTLSPAAFATLQEALSAGSSAVAAGSLPLGEVDLDEIDDSATDEGGAPTCGVCGGGGGDVAVRCRLCARRVCGQCSTQRVSSALDSVHASTLCVECMAAGGSVEAPLTALTDLPYRVPLIDVSYAAQCATPPHTCGACWQVTRRRLASTNARAVASGDAFFALLAAVRPQPPVALTPLSRQQVADLFICHAHAIASNELARHPPRTAIDLDELGATIMCNACDTPIVDNAIETLSYFWHSDCFNCQVCAISLAEAEFFVSEDNKPMCGKCYGIDD
jgi:hypothetical protein